MARRDPEPEADKREEDGPDPDDVLARGWMVALYGAALIPYGSWFVVFGSSILHYVWRKEFPNRAKTINRHGWLAWLMGIVLWGGIWFLFRHDAPNQAQFIPDVARAPAALATPEPASPTVEQRRDELMAQIQRKVATDAVARYQIAKRQGDKIQICVQAGMVAAAYLQAQDESEYSSWKGVQKADCAKAGMPQP